MPDDSSQPELGRTFESSSDVRRELTSSRSASDGRVFGEGPSNRRKFHPGKGVFDKMVVVGLIDNRMRKRLMKGDHI